MQLTPACRLFRPTRQLSLLIPLTCLSFGSVILGGCSGSSDDVRPPEAAPEELTDRSKPAVDTPEAELLSDGKRYFEAGLYSVAKDIFEKLRDGYPLGAYAEFAAIKVADCEFEASNFASAAGLYEEFLKNRPASPSTAYVLLRAARSNQLANRGLGRDDTTLHRAAELYEQLLKQYPSSPYAEGARGLLQQTQDTLAANEKLVVEYYERKNKEKAVEARKVAFANRFGRDVDLVDLGKEPEPLTEKLGAAPVGSQILFETSLGSVSQPNGETSAGDVLASEVAAPAGKGNRSPVQRPAAPSTALARGATQRGTFVRMVECDRAQRLVFLHLSQPITTPGSVEALGVVAGSPSGFAFSVKELTTPGAKALERDCFGNRDVVISPAGDISIKTTGSSAQLMELSDPPRILVAIDQ